MVNIHQAHFATFSHVLLCDTCQFYLVFTAYFILRQLYGSPECHLIRRKNHGLFNCYTGYEYIYSASLKSSDFILCEQRALF